MKGGLGDAGPLIKPQEPEKKPAEDADASSTADESGTLDAAAESGETFTAGDQ
ncbi:MAG: hypothetical protein ACYC4N_00345 [Pirellulaceae bacterium]